TDRYESVQEFIQDLEKYQNNLKVSAKEYGLLETLAKWAKRNRQKLAVVSVILILCIGFIGYSIWKEKHDQEQEIQKREIEREKECRDLLQKAEKAGGQAGEIEHVQNKEKLATKIQYLLEAFNFIEDVLDLKPEDLELQHQKKKLGEQLVQYTCQSEDYTLANHIAKSLGRLSILSEEEKKKLVDEVKIEENKLLESHKQRFTELLTSLLNPEAGEREIAWVEIAKMGEEEIFDRILDQVKEGTQYFLKNEGRTNKRDEYYQFFATALGNTSNPKACDPIITFLNQLCEPKISLAQNQKIKDLEPLFDGGELQYMIHLAQSLGNLKVAKTAEPLQSIRLKMGNGLFCAQTKYSLKQLLSLKSGYVIIGDATSFFIRGNEKLLKEDFEGAIVDFTEAIRLNPNRSEAHDNRGVAKSYKGDFEGAIKDFTEAIRLNPNNKAAYHGRGLTKYTKGDLEGSLVDFTEAIRLNPNDATT
ncbi:MAG: tetratricopeptide repeat protein, partial [Planctomycetota bacterium]